VAQAPARITSPASDYDSCMARVKQLAEIGIEVALRGMWVAILPPGLLRHELRGARVTRWRLPDLLADVDRAIATDGRNL
jgi:hypothetical protein